MNMKEQWIIGGCAAGFLGAVGLAALGYTYTPALMAPALTFGGVLAATIIGGVLGDAAFRSEAKNYRR